MSILNSLSLFLILLLRRRLFDKFVLLDNLFRLLNFFKFVLTIYSLRLINNLRFLLALLLMFLSIVFLVDLSLGVGIKGSLCKWRSLDAQVGELGLQHVK